MVVVKGKGKGGDEESTSVRKKKEDVLNQARAVLRQSQQFRPSTYVDQKNNNLSSRLVFQQQAQDDFWSPTGVVVDANAMHQPKYDYGTKSKSKLAQEDDFGLPFRDAMKKTPVTTLRSNLLQRHSSNSSTDLSLNTNELNVSSDDTSQSDSDSGHSISSVKKKTKKEVKILEPSTLKLTPLGATPAPPPKEPEETKAKSESSALSNLMIDSNIESETEPEPPSPAPLDLRPMTPPVARGLVEEDELGFSRALLKASTSDPHWFEKALLVRRESISEAAYKAFKKVQATQVSEKRSANQKKVKPIFTNLTDPEYTADWLSDGDQEEVEEEVPELPSEYVEDLPEEVTFEGSAALDEEENEIDDVDNSISIVKTASELESSGVLDEIADNLHSVLEITEQPESQEHHFKSRMSGEEKSLAREFEEEMDEESEPLKSIFNDIFHNPAEAPQTPEKKPDSPSRTTPPSRSHSQRQENIGNVWVKYEDNEDTYEYENTFIEGSTSLTLSKPTTKRGSPHKTFYFGAKDQKGSSSAPTLSVSAPKDKKSAELLQKAKAKTDLKAKASSEKQSTRKSKSSKSNLAKPSKNSKSNLSKSSKTSSSISSKHLPAGEREPHPSSRYQKNIQAILEKEVYQKELKKRRSQKLREERSQERLQIASKASHEKKKDWKDTDTNFTEVFLPELFKYKSTSGLQAAKAKRAIGNVSPLPPPVNFGAPYFSLNETISEQFGSGGILAAAQVESLDIPDLVREVLASNERMYKMTIQAGRQMAKVYKNKIRMRASHDHK